MPGNPHPFDRGGMSNALRNKAGLRSRMQAVWNAVAGIFSAGTRRRAEEGPSPSSGRGGQGAPSVQSPGTRRMHFVQRTVDRFERRNRASLLASLALHFIALLMVKWFAFPPQPVKPLLVEVELLAPEFGTRQKTLVAKARTHTVTRQARKPREKEPEFPQPREDMTAQLEKAPSPGAGGQPAGKAKAGAGRGVPPPTVKLPTLAEARPDQAEAPPAAQEGKPEPARPAASPWQQATAGSAVAPRIASPGQTASTRVQTQPRSGVESARGPTFLASQTSAAQSLPPEYRHSARPGGTVSSTGGTARSAMGNAARDDTHENTWQTASTGAQSAAATPGKAATSAGASATAQTYAARSPGPAGEPPAALYAATPAPGAAIAKVDRSVSAMGGASDRGVSGGRSTAAEARSGFAVAATGSGSKVVTGGPGGESSAASRASGGSTAETRPGFAVAAAGVSSRTAASRPGGEGSAAAGALSGSGTSEARSSFATAAAGGARQSAGQAGGEGSTSGRGIGSAPGEGGANLQASGTGSGGMSAAKGMGGGDLSERSAAGRGRGLEEGAGGASRLIAAADRAGSLGAFGLGAPAMAAGPEQTGTSFPTDEAPGAVLQEVAAKPEAHVMQERYEVGQLKSASPSTLCHLPLMLAGLGGTPIPKGLDNISMSAAAMDVEEPPRHHPGNRMPEYPFDGLVRQLEGRVVVRAQVLTNGRIGEVLVKIPSGSPILDRSALTAVKSWRFLPARRNGQPVTAWLDVPIQYSNPMKYR
jgi:TonB family protein